MSAGEAPIKQAVQWIDDQLRDNPAADRVKLTMYRQHALAP